MLRMDTFSDAYTPQQPTRDWYNGQGSYAGTIIGSCVVTLPAFAVSLAQLVDSLNPGAGWTYGDATAVLVQGAGGSSIDFYPYEGAQPFGIKDSMYGPNANPFPYWLARNRSQLINMRLADPAGSGEQVILQFYTGNPNVTP